MKLTYTTLLPAFLLSAVNIAHGQQLPYRSTFANTDFFFNPAMTAPAEYLEWGATYRQQWLGFEEAPGTASAYIQYPFVYNNMSIGGSLSLDKAGPLQRNSFVLTYSYKLQLGLSSSDQLSIGVLAGMNQQRFNPDNIIAADVDDLLLNSMEGSSSYSNFGFGLFYVSNTGIYTNDGNGLFFGIGSNQLFAPKLGGNETGLPRSIHANALLGGRFTNNFSYVEPSVWLNYSADNIFHVSGNILYELTDAFWAGLTYSTDQTVSIQGGVILKNGLLEKGYLRVGGQGTFNTGKVGDAQGFGFEFLLAYRYWL